MERQAWPDNAETIFDGLDGVGRPAPAPERIGAYRVEGRLGFGGMGEVFLAWDARLERRVAIKRVRQNAGLSPEQRERFRREARLAAGRLETAEVLRLALEIAEGLAAAHEAGLVHRDLKAANVIITRSGHAKILDFGLARPVDRAPEDQGFTRQGVLLGTCHAMSPEQARGEELDERSDLFSFGALVYEMLTGRPPFRGNDPIDSQGGDRGAGRSVPGPAGSPCRGGRPAAAPARKEPRKAAGQRPRGDRDSGASPDRALGATVRGAGGERERFRHRPSHSVGTGAAPCWWGRPPHCSWPEPRPSSLELAASQHPRKTSPL